MIALCQCAKVPGCQGAKVQRCQGAKVPGCTGAAMDAMQSTFDELYVYTMGREGFVLQHVVDAYGAQTADDATKPIRLVFALVGLYLRVERGFSGHEVQRVHMLMGRRKQ